MQDSNSTTEVKESSKPAVFVDAKGLKCPMPVIKLQQQVRKSQPDEIITIACTDPGAEKDISSWCRVNKHELIHIEKTEYGCDISVKVKQR